MKANAAHTHIELVVGKLHLESVLCGLCCMVALWTRICKLFLVPQHVMFVTALGQHGYSRACLPCSHQATPVTGTTAGARGLQAFPCPALSRILF